MTRSLLASVVGVLTLACALHAQPLIAPYTFAFDNDVEIDTALMQGFMQPAGSHGRLKLDEQGRLQFADGTRFRVVGTNLQWFSCFPDSAMAIKMAKRFRALGINTVRFTTFDVTIYPTVSIFATESKTSALDPSQMRRLDWFVYQLKQHGVYSAFTFQSFWSPRADDGVVSPDSTGFGARIPLIFNAAIQRVHRNVIRTLLNHVNTFTNVAYKDEPAIAFIVATEDASFSAYWLYSKDVVQSNPYGVMASGDSHVRRIDSLYNAWLRGKGFTTDAQLTARWSQPPASTANQLQNAGFEDPFSSVWVLGVNTGTGAQAVSQFSELDKHEGSQSMRIRINSLDTSKSPFGIYLLQVANKLKRLQRYTISFWAKTTADRGSRTFNIYALNSIFPNESYGLAASPIINAQWKQYTYPFTCSGSDSTSAWIFLALGSDSGDVFLDDFRLVETGFPGLYPGETIANNSIYRPTFFTDSLGPKRSKDESAFYLESVETMFTNVRKLVRDTIKSEVLMCPSARLMSFFDLYATRDYDIFSAIDARYHPLSVLTTPGGGSMTNHASSRPAGKAMIMLNSSIAHTSTLPNETALYRSAYQSELGVTLPAYMGLQDWDGVFFSNYASVPLAGRASADSTGVWDIIDKPNILAMLPSTSRSMQEGVVSPSLRSIVIENTRETLEYPRLHLSQQYSLRLGTDSRIPLFRRVAMSTELAAAESVFPHLEVSGLSGSVDLTNLNSETQQLFWNVATATFKVQTDRYIAVSGRITNQLIQMPGLILEETSPSRHTSIVLNSLTDLPLFLTPAVFLTIATRSANEGATFHPVTGAVNRFGTGTTQMEGSIVRITYTAPEFDTMYVQPLGANAQPLGERIPATRTSSGRFSVTVNTTQNATPWYRMEFGKVVNSIGDASTQRPLIIAPNPTSDEAMVYHSDDVTDVVVLSVTGDIVASHSNISGTRTQLPLHTLPSGVYVVRVVSAQGLRETMLNVVR